MIVLEMMVDLSPLYVSLKTAIITIIINNPRHIFTNNM